MSALKIKIEFHMKGDLDDHESLKQEVYNTIQELIDEDELEFKAKDMDSDEDEEEADYA